jgi:hypothetical protein
MKKLFLVFVCLFCVSCFDIFHYIELTADKKFKSEYRISFSKALFAMGGVNSPVANLDVDDLINKPELKKMDGVFSGTKKETDASIILHLKYIGTENSLTKKIETDSFPMLPFKDENNQYVFLFRQNKTTAPSGIQENQMAEAIMSGPVYRMLVGGELKPKKAVFKKKNQETGIDIEIIPMGTQYLIEFPISYILKETGAFVISFSGEIKLDSVNKLLIEEPKESKEVSEPKNTKEVKPKPKSKQKIKEEESF